MRNPLEEEPAPPPTPRSQLERDFDRWYFEEARDIVWIFVKLRVWRKDEQLPVVNAVLETAWSKFSELPEDQVARRSWLRTAVQYEVSNDRRRFSKHREKFCESPLDESTADRFSQQVEGRPLDPECQAVDSDFLDRLRRALDRFDEETKTCFELRVYGDASVAEIAQLFNLDPREVRNRVDKVLNHLRIWSASS